MNESGYTSVDEGHLQNNENEKKKEQTFRMKKSGTFCWTQNFVLLLLPEMNGKIIQN